MITQRSEIITAKLESFLDDTTTFSDLPGLVAGVYCGDVSDVPFIGARGYSDYMNRTPLKTDDIFHCASVSKLFTASAVMKLVQENVLSLDDKLVDLLPDLDFADERCKGIRLHHMLSHTSGLGDCDDYHWENPLTDDEALKRYVYSDEVCKQPMVWEPETGFRYSNVAFEILGHIVSVCSERLPQQKGERLSYEDFIRKYCFVPASMDNSTMKTYERPEGSLVSPHVKGDDRSIGPVEHYPYTRQHSPSSTLTSNADDLLKWGRSHLDDAKAGIWSHDVVWQPRAVVPNNGEEIGIGWFIRKQTVSDGTTYTLYGHEGSDDGFRSSFWICPELNMAVVVLSNLSNAPVKKINKKLFSLIAGD